MSTPPATLSPADRRADRAAPSDAAGILADVAATATAALRHLAIGDDNPGVVQAGAVAELRAHLHLLDNLLGTTPPTPVVATRPGTDWAWLCLPEEPGDPQPWVRVAGSHATVQRDSGETLARLGAVIGGPATSTPAAAPTPGPVAGENGMIAAYRRALAIAGTVVPLLDGVAELARVESDEVCFLASADTDADSLDSIRRSRVANLRRVARAGGYSWVPDGHLSHDGDLHLHLVTVVNGVRVRVYAIGDSGSPSWDDSVAWAAEHGIEISE